MTALVLALLAAIAPSVPLRACSCSVQERPAGCCCCARADAGEGCCCGDGQAPRAEVCGCTQDPAPQQAGPAGIMLDAPQPAGLVTVQLAPSTSDCLAHALPEVAEPPGHSGPLLL